jgi:hypothetical protein
MAGPLLFLDRFEIGPVLLRGRTNSWMVADRRQPRQLFLPLRWPFFKIQEDHDLFVIARISDELSKMGHTFLIIRRFELYSCFGWLRQAAGDRIQCGHIDTGPEKEGLFVLLLLVHAQILGSCPNDVGEERLMSCVIIGEKSADRVDFFVQVLQQGAGIVILAETLFQFVHSGAMDWFIGMDSEGKYSKKIGSFGNCDCFFSYSKGQGIQFGQNGNFLLIKAVRS